MSPSPTLPSGPIILVGVGRSGSTALHRALAHHPAFAVLTGAAERWPRRPGRNRLACALRQSPGIGGWARGRLAPGECYQFWESHRPGLRRPYRDLRADDVLPRDRRDLPQALAAALPPGKIPLLKFTGWPRVGFLAEVFPEARFVHVLRDGRAVAASLLAVGFWRGWQGPGGWRWGALPPELDARWRVAKEDFATLAGLQWQLLVEAFDRAKSQLPEERFLEVRYEDLCADPAATFGDLLRFCGLLEGNSPPPARDVVGNATFLRRLERLPFRSANDKWKQRLDPRQIQRLEQAIGPALEARAYPLSGT
ncbi:MAG: sulfotransferase [Acidobacteriota bacterium]